jgi:hypothetical protein
LAPKVKFGTCEIKDSMNSKDRMQLNINQLIAADVIKISGVVTQKSNNNTLENDSTFHVKRRECDLGMGIS